MTRREQIKNAYKLTGGHAGFYDGMMTYSTLPGKAICRIVWNMDGEKNLRYLEKALSGIPEDFSGKLLEVPVGTGVLTMPVYRDLPDADITCLDYSENMMASAQEKAKAVGIRNITFMQGDVGAMPFEDESFDIVLSLNGFHAFPDKEAAYRETFRVLKPGADAFTYRAAVKGLTGSSGICISRKAFSHRLMKQSRAFAGGFQNFTRKQKLPWWKEWGAFAAGNKGFSDHRKRVGSAYSGSSSCRMSDALILPLRSTERS